MGERPEPGRVACRIQNAKRVDPAEILRVVGRRLFRDDAAKRYDRNLLGVSGLYRPQRVLDRQRSLL